MIQRVNPCNAIEPLSHFGQGRAVYQPQAVDRAMSTITQYMKPLPGFMLGVVPSDVGALPLVNESYGGRFATADLPRINMPPGWERIQK